MVDGLNTSTYTPSGLIAGEYPRAMRAVLITGAAALLAGTALGRTLTGAAAVGAAVAGNTGNGVLAGVAAGAGAQVGVYRLICVEPAANGGVFTVEDPNGVEIGRANVGVAFNTQIQVTIGDGAVDFIAGDSFTITVSGGTEKFLKSLAAAVDGSQVPVGILAQDTDVTAGDKKDAVYFTGEFNENAVIFGAGHTADSTRWALSQKNIYLRKPVGA